VRNSGRIGYCNLVNRPNISAPPMLSYRRDTSKAGCHTEIYLLTNLTCLSKEIVASSFHLLLQGTSIHQCEKRTDGIHALTLKEPPHIRGGQSCKTDQETVARCKWPTPSDATSGSPQSGQPGGRPIRIPKFSFADNGRRPALAATLPRALKSSAKIPPSASSPATDYYSWLRTYGISYRRNPSARNKMSTAELMFA